MTCLLVMHCLSQTSLHHHRTVKLYRLALKYWCDYLWAARREFSMTHFPPAFEVWILTLMWDNGLHVSVGAAGASGQVVLRAQHTGGRTSWKGKHSHAYPRPCARPNFFWCVFGFIVSSYSFFILCFVKSIYLSKENPSPGCLSKKTEF